MLAEYWVLINISDKLQTVWSRSSCWVRKIFFVNLHCTHKKTDLISQAYNTDSNKHLAATYCITCTGGLFLDVRMFQCFCPTCMTAQNLNIHLMLNPVFWITITHSVIPCKNRKQSLPTYYCTTSKNANIFLCSKQLSPLYAYNHRHFG